MAKSTGLITKVISQKMKNPLDSFSSSSAGESGLHALRSGEPSPPEVLAMGLRFATPFFFQGGEDTYLESTKTALHQD